MLGVVAGYAPHHYFLGTPELNRNPRKPTKLYKGRKKWVKIINPKRKKYPMIIKEAK